MKTFVRSAALGGFIGVLAVTASAQMGGGPRPGGSINMMSTEVLAPAAGRGSGGMMDGDDLYQIYVVGLQPPPRARVNVMVTNSGDTAVTGTLDILDADGLAPVSGVVSLPFSIRAYSSHQFGGVLSGVASRFGDGSATQLRVRLANGSTGMVMVLASVVDSVTNDTYTIMGSMMDSSRGMMP